jgi:hypothetical protein
MIDPTTRKEGPWYAVMPIKHGHRVQAEWPGGKMIGTYDGRQGDMIHLGAGKLGVTTGKAESWINLRTVYVLTDLGPDN